jgi:hypothetical protein
MQDCDVHNAYGGNNVKSHAGRSFESVTRPP